MDKSEMKSVLETIEKKLKSKKSVSFMEHDNKPAWRVLENLFDNSNEIYEFNLKRYEIKYRPSEPTIGGRSSTPEFEVKLYKPVAVFDIDEILNRKEIVIRGWACAQVDVKKFGLKSDQYEFTSNQLLMEIVNQIYENSDLNIMIQRHKTGDVTVWTDTKKFGQR